LIGAGTTRGEAITIEAAANAEPVGTLVILLTATTTTPLGVSRTRAAPRRAAGPAATDGMATMTTATTTVAAAIATITLTTTRSSTERPVAAPPLKAEPALKETGCKTNATVVTKTASGRVRKTRAVG
jgi:hypothetical protein